MLLSHSYESRPSPLPPLSLPHALTSAARTLRRLCPLVQLRCGLILIGDAQERDEGLYADSPRLAALRNRNTPNTTHPPRTSPRLIVRASAPLLCARSRRASSDYCTTPIPWWLALGTLAQLQVLGGGERKSRTRPQFPRIKRRARRIGSVERRGLEPRQAAPHHAKRLSPTGETKNSLTGKRPLIWHVTASLLKAMVPQVWDFARQPMRC